MFYIMYEKELLTYTLKTNVVMFYMLTVKYFSVKSIDFCNVNVESIVCNIIIRN